jgi:hypothetical protein
MNIEKLVTSNRHHEALLRHHYKHDSVVNANHLYQSSSIWIESGGSLLGQLLLLFLVASLFFHVYQNVSRFGLSSTVFFLFARLLVAVVFSKLRLARSSS